MGTEFDDALSEITGAGSPAAPDIQPEQAQSAPAESDPFEESLAAQIQEPAPERSQELPEPGGGMER